MEEFMTFMVALFDFEFIAATHVEAVAEMVLAHKTVEEGKWPLMITPNVDQIVKLGRDENQILKQELKRAAWVLPDGQPLVSLSRLIYKNNGLPARLTGSDFFPVMWYKVKKLNLKTMFILPSNDLGERFMAEHPGVRYYAPPFFQITNEALFQVVIEHVERIYDEHSPDFLFIGLGFPKQERIVIELYKKLEKQGRVLPRAFLLGASFEYYWGQKKRAPKIWQKLGIEFIYRLISEPRRMFRRYLVDDLKFLPMAIAEFRNRRNRPEMNR